MPIYFHLDKVLCQRQLRLEEVSEAINISMNRLRRMMSGQIREINLDALNALCELLDCQPADILEYDNARRERDR